MNLTGAETAPNIAEITVLGDRVHLALEVYVGNLETFEALLEDRGFRREFISTIIGRLRYLTQRIHYLTAYDVEQRFFRFLYEQYGPVEKCSVEIPKKEIAAAIGTIPETLARLILRLRERGDIEWKGSTITLRKGFWEDREENSGDRPAR